MRIINYILLGFLFLGALACQEDRHDVEGGGRIRLSLTDRVFTKALPDALTPELTGQFLVEMVRKEDHRMAFRGSCTDFNTKPQLFKVGEYAIQAFYGDNPVLAMDAPYYVSEEKTIVLEKGKEQEVTLHCTVGNALASFEFVNADKLEKVLKEYYIEVAVHGARVEWHPGSAENPYFRADSSVEFYLKGIWMENNLPYARKFAGIALAEAGKLYRYQLNFDISNMTGAILDIHVDSEVKNVTVNETLPPAWLPKPKITAEGFDEENLLVYPETADAATAIIRFAAVRPVQDVELTLNFSDPKLSVLNKTYVFSSLTDEDKEALQKAAIAVSVWDGDEKSGSIDLTNLTSSLLLQDGGVEVNNRIGLRVKANERWSDEVCYTIRTVRPEFSIGVFQGNIWTKEFTANALVADSVKTGNFGRFKDIAYEFSEDGENWTAFAADLRKEGLAPGTTYYVRPKYRGQVPGIATAVRTYEALTIPNSSLDDGYETTYPKSKNPLYTFNGGWIGTRNPLTCHSAGVNALYVSKSSTIPVTDNGSTVAHMMTIGWGSGNTCSFGNKNGSKINNVSAGMVCVGDYQPEQDSVYARSAYIRPTSLSFVYKAAPYGDDEFLVSAQLVHIAEGVETLIGKAEMKSGIAQSGYVSQRLNLVYRSECERLPITHLRIIFKAGTKEDKDHLEDKFIKEGSGTFYSNYYIRGSQLWLDSFTLNYEK